MATALFDRATFGAYAIRLGKAVYLISSTVIKPKFRSYWELIFCTNGCHATTVFQDILYLPGSSSFSAKVFRLESAESSRTLVFNMPKMDACRSQRVYFLYLSVLHHQMAFDQALNYKGKYLLVLSEQKIRRYPNSESTLICILEKSNWGRSLGMDPHVAKSCRSYFLDRWFSWGIGNRYCHFWWSCTESTQLESSVPKYDSSMRVW